MIRHIFMYTIKDGVSDEVVERKMAEMRAMKDSVPEIEFITVQRNLGWVGPDNVVTMIIDLKDKAAFDALMASAKRIQRLRQRLTRCFAPTALCWHRLKSKSKG